jgi:hypothetical protein
MTRFLFGIMIAACMSGTPCSGQMKAETLLLGCSGTDETQKLSCLSYVLGFVDGMASAAVNAPSGRRAVCIPSEGVSGFQMVRIVTKWLEDHPKDLHTSARVQVLMAFRDAFPCK